mmetsp:Transcript_52467/g.131972  ORF Transcript_52467/g.131972 Transcript_52467/m.131972 type:complete len:232 (-) Transcript_52467:131-826(-)|eukprot:CAMPEP_0177656862 /NCGR_PEP_ID=MMETSP0447-20121125/15833_1 /TAXON_ID=0 /ORGANISM="Stygamoeba regulata, Strain BSH-02190019" /LENGTH=231 /DNA_ID=CAMNT_0019161089 /DNA_START=220 /DNA_END=915 /DNA_ORIENTATION=-
MDDSGETKVAKGLVRELNSLNFDKLIGGPLVHIVKAQAQGSLATINFVRRVGFYVPKNIPKDMGVAWGEPLMISFEWEAPNPRGSGLPVRSIISVPMITCLPIPNLRVETVEVNFLAQIQAVSTLDMSNNLAQTGSATARADGFAAADPGVEYATSSSMLTSVQNKRTTRKGWNVTHNYHLKTNVRCSQGPLPAGLDRLLGILDNAIAEVEEDYREHANKEASAKSSEGAK